MTNIGLKQKRKLESGIYIPRRTNPPHHIPLANLRPADNQRREMLIINY
jgi:hypothetical protein